MKCKNLSLQCMDRSWPVGSGVTKAIATARKRNMERAIICVFYVSDQLCSLCFKILSLFTCWLYQLFRMQEIRR